LKIPHGCVSARNAARHRCAARKAVTPVRRATIRNAGDSDIARTRSGQFAKPAAPLSWADEKSMAAESFRTFVLDYAENRNRMPLA
jgi:hypothetical protein